MAPYIASIKKKAPSVLRRHGVKRAALFGSVARGESKRSSDIDLLVEFGKGKSLFDLVSLQDELTREFKRKFDVVTYRSLNPLIRRRVLQDEAGIYEKRS